MGLLPWWLLSAVWYPAWPTIAAQLRTGLLDIDGLAKYVDIGVTFLPGNLWALLFDMRKSLLEFSGLCLVHMTEILLLSIVGQIRIF